MLITQQENKIWKVLSTYARQAWIIVSERNQLQEAVQVNKSRGLEEHSPQIWDSHIHSLGAGMQRSSTRHEWVSLTNLHACNWTSEYIYYLSTTDNEDLDTGSGVLVWRASWCILKLEILAAQDEQRHGEGLFVSQIFQDLETAFTSADICCAATFIHLARAPCAESHTSDIHPKRKMVLQTNCPTW